MVCSSSRFATMRLRKSSLRGLPSPPLSEGEIPKHSFLYAFFYAECSREKIYSFPDTSSSGRILRNPAKIEFSALLNGLSHIKSESNLLAHPKINASREGYAIEEILHHYQPDQE
jgi:hypothetical protein